MRILNIAFALAYVGDDAVGGAEQVLGRIERAQVAAGHQSLVVAAEGSKVCGTLFATPGRPERISDSYYRHRYVEHRRRIAEALDTGVDLVHMHGYDFHEFIPAGDVPVLVTVHLPPNWYPERIYTMDRPRLYLNCVSNTQRRMAPKSPLIVRTINNGVPIPALESLPVCQRRGAVMLGRICPEKGTHLGIAAARKAGVPLSIAGRTFGYPEHLTYFNQQVLPAMDESITLIPQLGFGETVGLLRTAKCLLVPSTVPETSSLVSMEALACGTPVIAMKTGALPEIVEHGRTGFLVESVDEMAAAISQTQGIDPCVCRRVAVERFSAERMSREYLELYEQMLASDAPPVNTLMRGPDCEVGRSPNC